MSAGRPLDAARTPSTTAAARTSAATFDRGGSGPRPAGAASTRRPVSRPRDLLAGTLSDADLHAATARGVVLFVRTSTDAQADRSRHASPSAQLESGYADAARYGVPRSAVAVIEAFGEAGTRRVERVQFRKLCAWVRSGTVGLVIVPEHHRLSRNVRDAESFFIDCAAAGVLLLINGQPFDPARPVDRYVLGMMAQFAQYENDARMRWMVRTRLHRARERKARFHLPTGLVWARPDDMRYRDALTKAGLSHVLRAMSQHRVKSPASDGTYHILPFPDATVEAAARLRVAWFLETGSVKAVVARIQAGARAWPRGREGLVPVPRPVTRWHDKLRYDRDDDWERVTYVGTAEYLRSPALYGIYAVYMGSLGMPTGSRRHRLARWGADGGSDRSGDDLEASDLGDLTTGAGGARGLVAARLPNGRASHRNGLGAPLPDLEALLTRPAPGSGEDPERSDGAAEDGATGDDAAGDADAGDADAGGLPPTTAAR